MSQRSKKARQSKLKVKVMSITFLSVRGIMYCEFLSQEQMINQQSLQRDPAAFASPSSRDETRVVAGQPVAISPRECTCSQGPEHPALLAREEQYRAGTTSLFT